MNKVTLGSVKFPTNPFTFKELAVLNPEVNPQTLRLRLRESMELNATKVTGQTVSAMGLRGRSQVVYIHS